MPRAPSFVVDVLSWARLRLASAGIRDGSEEIILSHVFRSRDPLAYQPFMRNRLLPDQREIVFRMVQERALGAPIQHVIGEWDFLGLPLKMRRPVFIPRVQAEDLFNYSRVFLEIQKLPTPRILEVGCGCGAITVSLLQAFPNARVTAVDRSLEAVRLTAENASLLEVLAGNPARLALHHLILRQEGFVNPMSASTLVTLSDRTGFGPPFDLVISNPPYISSSEVLSMPPERLIHEDVNAFDGGPDGLDVIRAILVNLPNWLRRGKVMAEDIQDVRQEMFQLSKSSHVKSAQPFSEAIAIVEVGQKHPAVIQDLLDYQEPFKSTLRFLGWLPDVTNTPRYVLIGRKKETQAKTK